MKKFYHILAFAALSMASLSAQDRIYVVGNGDGWGDETGPFSDAVLNKVKVGNHDVFQGVLPARIASEVFRFYSQLDWDYSIGRVLEAGEAYDQSKEFEFAENLEIAIAAGSEGAMRFTNVPAGTDLLLTVDLTDNKVTANALPDEIYMLGGSIEWDFANSKTLISQGNGVYSATMKSSEVKPDGNGDGFRIYFSKGGWHDLVVSPESDDEDDRIPPTLSASDRTVTAKAVVYNGKAHGKFAVNNLPDDIDGNVRVTVDIANSEFKIEYQNALYVPENLYLVGGLDRANWNPANAPKLDRISESVFQIKNVVFDLNNGTSGFQFVTERNWTSDRFLAPAAGIKLSPDNRETQFSLYKSGEATNLQHNIDIARGIYDITVDFSTGTVSVIPVDQCDDMVFRVNTSFWEGPINEALRGENQSAKDIPFELVEAREDGVYVYRIRVADEIAPIEYVSQMWMGGYATLNRYTCTDGVITKERILSTNADGEADDKWRNFYFDAHSTDALVPVTTDFWCDNSRIEVGLTVKAIYLGVYTNRPFNPEIGETPFRILLSSTGDIDLNAPEQRPFNSSEYAITLTSGDLYEALKGTRSGKITVPFSRHAPAQDAYVINLGKSVTLTKSERFELLVDGKSANRSFSIDGTNKFIPGPGSRSVSSIDGDLTFNQIILYVNGKDHDDYRMWLRNGTTMDSAPDDYNKHYRNPMLKVWTNGDASWDAMYNSSKQPTYSEGNVKYYAFEPVYKGDIKTNLYYLDLPEGIRIRKAGYGEGNKHYDQFNILDQDGYDVSNPYQGSQFIYPETWWCANPNLMAKEGTPADQVRSYQGHEFVKVPTFPSRVDLSWNLADDEGDEVTIYGITLFKIIGSVYDIYAENETETNLYYVYAHTQPRSGDLRAKCEQTAPIMLRVKGADGKMSETAAGALVKYQPKFASQFRQFNDPGLKDENGNYLLKLSPRALTYNTDLNYILDGISLIPTGKTDIEFVDVNGSQRWAADGTADELRPNKWSNYYAGDFHESRALNLNAPGRDYYKVVLATNPDQVRYQIMSKGMTIDANSRLVYQSTNDPEFDSANELIYPVADISTVLTWQEGYRIKVTLTFTDKDGRTVSVPVEINEKPEGSNLTDADGFYENGEVPFEAPLGKYVTAPGVTISASAEYIPTEEGKEPLKSLDSKSRTTIDLPVPVLEDLTADTDTDKSDADNGKYVSDLKWSTDDADFPRHYEFYQNDLNNSDTDYAITDHNCHYNGGTSLKEVTLNGATPLDNGNYDETANTKTVTIGYNGQAHYHFAVPENDIAVALKSEPNFMEIPEGSNLKKISTSSDMRNTTADFVKDNTTGVEDIDIDNQQAEFYNLHGVRVENPSAGVFIRRQGNSVTKVMIP